MRAPSRIFVSHLAGKSVFDPDGDPVGRVRDLVVAVPVGGQARRGSSAWSLEVHGRRRIFLPITRVTAIESGQVVSTGAINMRRFQQRPSETLVLAELLDRRVTLTATGEQATVLDVGHGADARRPRTGDHQGLRAERAKHGLRRRGETLTVDWDAVHRLLPHRGRAGRRQPASPPSTSCAPPTWRTSCTS